MLRNKFGSCLRFDFFSTADASHAYSASQIVFRCSMFDVIDVEAHSSKCTRIVSSGLYFSDLLDFSSLPVANSPSRCLSVSLSPSFY